MTRIWACITPACLSFSSLSTCIFSYLICFHSSYRIVIKLHFYNVRQLSNLYRLKAGFQRFSCKKSASFDNLSAKDCYYIVLYTFVYFIVTAKLYIIYNYTAFFFDFFTIEISVSLLDSLQKSSLVNLLVEKEYFFYFHTTIRFRRNKSE